MSASSSTNPRAVPLCIAQVIGITAPAIYASLTFAYSRILIPPLLAHAPPKILAKQWLQAYQYAIRFVPPLIISGTVANALLAYFSPSRTLKITYSIATGMTWCIMPWTMLWFEPNINGSAKWKVQKVLEQDGYNMKENERPIPGVDRHTGTPQARRWAETVGMKDIVEEWSRQNDRRWVATGLATLLSATATCVWGSNQV